MPKNHRAFLALIYRYETIDLQEIEDVWADSGFVSNDAEFVAMAITGFGSMRSCTLCQAIMRDFYHPIKNDEEVCQDCVYSKLPGNKISFKCIEPLRKHDKSYQNILDATTPQELLNAYRARAEEMKIFFKEHYDAKQDD